MPPRNNAEVRNALWPTKPLMSTAGAAAAYRRRIHSRAAVTYKPPVTSSQAAKAAPNGSSANGATISANGGGYGNGSVPTGVTDSSTARCAAMS